MANVYRTITLTSDPGNAGPLYDVYYSTDCVNYTICTDGSSVSLPTVGSTALVTFPDNTTCIKMVNLSVGCGNNYVIETLLFLDYLVVGGGGAGGATRHAGGGGAGGLASGSFGFVLSTAYTVTVGAGGVGNEAPNLTGNNGSGSVFNTISVLGGGGGGGNGTIQTGASGSSGGGGNAASVGSSNWGLGTSGQGFRGGEGYETSPYAGGGGGGASTSGSNASSVGGGNGGSGSLWNGNYYAGGGGGGWYRDQSTPTFIVGAGGVGGGGAGGSYSAGTTVAPQNGTANTGGGGGGLGNGSNGGSGGSGVVILKYSSAYSASVSAGLTASTVTTGSYKITTFTSGSGTVTFS